jgi:hypothetical protein
VVGVVTSASVDADYFRRVLGVHEELAHITVEVCHIPMSGNLVGSLDPGRVEKDQSPGG